MGDGAQGHDHRPTPGGHPGAAPSRRTGPVRLALPHRRARRPGDDAALTHRPRARPASRHRPSELQQNPEQPSRPSPPSLSERLRSAARRALQKYESASRPGAGPAGVDKLDRRRLAPGPRVTYLRMRPIHRRPSREDGPRPPPRLRCSRSCVRRADGVVGNVQLRRRCRQDRARARMSLPRNTVPASAPRSSPSPALTLAYQHNHNQLRAFLVHPYTGNRRSSALQRPRRRAAPCGGLGAAGHRHHLHEAIARAERRCGGASQRRRPEPRPGLVDGQDAARRRRRDGRRGGSWSSSPRS